MMEGVAHFPFRYDIRFIWILPRTSETTERGLAFLASDVTCTEAQAAEFATKLRQLFGQW